MNTGTLPEVAFSSPPSTFSTGLAPASPSGKTYRAHSAAVRAAILQAWLVSWQDSTTLQSPRTAGETKAARLATMECSNGALWTRNGSEWRSGAVACSLSSILETGPVDRRYFLSPVACAGILRRAEKRGKALPLLLEAALTAQLPSAGGRDHTINDGLTCSQQGAVAFHESQRAEVSINDTMGALSCGGGKPGQGYPALLQSMQARRLTPRECERLQGFPDDYTLGPYRGKPAADGPRYKALGNSMAVPVMRHIGIKIMEAVWHI